MLLLLGNRCTQRRSGSIVRAPGGLTRGPVMNKPHSIRRRTLGRLGIAYSLRVIESSGIWPTARATGRWRVECTPDVIYAVRRKVLGAISCTERANGVCSHGGGRSGFLHTSWRLWFMPQWRWRWRQVWVVSLLSFTAGSSRAFLLRSGTSVSQPTPARNRGRPNAR